eukprot:g6256.t1
MISRNIYAAQDYATRAIYKESKPNDVLQDRTMASMTGVLQQLGFLATYSAQIFDGVYAIAKQTDARMKKVTTKLTALQREVPRLETLAAGKSPSDFVLNSESSFRRDYKVSSQLFTKETRPAHVKIQYDSVNQPPRVHLLDPFQPEGSESCMKKYSDPEFFFREWLREEEKKLAIAKEAKKQRRRERRQRKKQSKRIQVQRMDVRNYEVDETDGTRSRNDENLFETADEASAKRLQNLGPPSRRRTGEDDDSLGITTPSPNRAPPGRPSPPVPKKQPSFGGPSRAPPSRPQPQRRSPRTPPPVVGGPAASPRRKPPVPGSPRRRAPEPTIASPQTEAVKEAPQVGVATSGTVSLGPGQCRVADHPQYEKYFKQLKKGVLPRMAIERNMIMLQLRTELLDTPDLPVSIDSPPTMSPVAKKKRVKAKTKTNTRRSAPRKGLTLQEQLKGFDRSKLVKARPVKAKKSGGRDSILEQIRRGMKLKDSKKRKLKKKKEPEQPSGMNSDIARVMKERYGVLHGGDSDSDDEDWNSDDSEFDW